MATQFCKDCGKILNENGYCNTGNCPNQDLDLDNDEVVCCMLCGNVLSTDFEPAEGICELCWDSDDYQDTEIQEEKIDL